MLLSRIRELLADEKSQLERLKNEVEEIGGGNLNVYKKGEVYYFSENRGGRRKGISRDMERVFRLARKCVLMDEIALNEKKIAVMDEAIMKIELIEASRDKGKIDRLGMIDREHYAYSDREKKWIKDRQSKNPYHREHIRYATNGGVMVRSKSERSIGNYLEAKGLIYMYEPMIEIEGKPVYPDFVVLKPDGETVVWEHCGLMDDIGYFNRTMVKINEYRKIGYTQNRNLICTYEEDLLNMDSLERIVRRFCIK